MRKKTRTTLSRLLYSLALASVGVLCLAPCTDAAGQSVGPAEHPNHYIVLIDASGSTRSSAAKKAVYEEALKGTLVTRLFQTGFGPVPAYEREHDLVSLHNFGVVIGGDGNAYDRLADYDLLTQFIHPVFLRRAEIDAELFRNSVVPQQTYQYTILSWAKQLALKNSAPVQPSKSSGRTFMILVHDGIPNENSLAEEVGMIRRWNATGYEPAANLVNQINTDYRFTDTKGETAPAWSEAVRGESQGATPIFLEAYEVVSVEQARWEEEGRHIRPSEDLSFYWTTETGDAPAGTLSFTLSEAFKNWIGAADEPSISVRAERDSGLVSSPRTELTVNFTAALACTPRDIDTEITATMQRSDKLLGNRSVQYTHREAITPPAPLGCTVGYFASRGVALLIAAFIASLIIYYLYYRFYATHLELEIPGTILPFRLMRRGRTSITISIAPQAEMEALSIRLPGPLIQTIFYSSATLTLRSENETVQWSGSDTARIKLPVARKHVLARWRELPHERTSIGLIYKHGGKQAEIVLHYPGGNANSSKDTSL